jgi:hypothetical protein
VRRFLDGLFDEDIRFEVEYHKDPRNIDEAVNLIQTRKFAKFERRNFTRRAQTTDEENNETPINRTQSGYTPDRKNMLMNTSKMKGVVS